MLGLVFVLALISICIIAVKMSNNDKFITLIRDSKYIKIKIDWVYVWWALLFIATVSWAIVARILN